MELNHPAEPVEENWRKKWEPVFRAAREGRLPNRLQEVLEVSQELHRHHYHWQDRPNLDEVRAWLAEHAKTCACKQP